jgi:succinyl-CoA synthetase alpha subunit
VSILVGNGTKVVVQGISGSHGSFHTRGMMEYGTSVVAGVVPGRGGQTFDETVPIFNTVIEAREKAGANASLIFVPAPFAADAIIEAADAGMDVVVCITEGIPAADMVKVKDVLTDTGATLIGPNTPGIITPAAKCKLGIQAGWIHSPGHVGLVSRSGTLTYEAVNQLTRLGIGQSTCIGLGGDPVIGTTFLDAIRLFEKDPDTKGLVLIGEIGGDEEERAAEYISDNLEIPVVAFVAGKTAPPGRRMGHAGAVISGGKGTAADKIRAFEAVGVAVAPTPADIGTTMQAALKGRR